MWNLPLKHPVNLAYEAATADLSDVNMIDPFHLQAYGKVTVNYNRDVESFPILSAIFKKIYGSCPYQSPTDMGVNMVGYCISDDAVCQEASKQEIVRRYYKALLERVNNYKEQGLHEKEISGIESIMDQTEITAQYRRVVKPALEAQELSGGPAAAIEMPDGTIITGKTKDMLGCLSSMLINALKYLAGIEDSLELIPKNLLDPVQKLKTVYLGAENPRLHSDETLIALAVNAANDENAERALQALPLLRGCDAHLTVIPSGIDIEVFRRLNINLTCEPKYQGTKLFRL